MSYPLKIGKKYTYADVLKEKNIYSNPQIKLKETDRHSKNFKASREIEIY